MSLCKDHVKAIAANVSEWTVYWDTNVKIKYCLSQQVDERCMVQFSIQIMTVIIACNFVKAISMLAVLFSYNEPPLVTIGDAIASFLTSQDMYTQDRCLTTVNNCRSANVLGFVYTWPPSISRQWDGSPSRWLHGASEMRWMTCDVL